MSDEKGGRFTEEQARAILARAIDIDSRAPMTTADDLRAIAADVGIAPASLEAALRENTTALAARRNAASRRAANVVVALGVPLGVATGFALIWGVARGSILAATGLTTLGYVASGVLVLVQGQSGTVRSFLLRNLALWMGIAAGSTLAGVLWSGGTGVPPFSTAIWCLRQWLPASIVGSAAVIAIRQARHRDDADGDRSVNEPALPAGAGRWTRIAQRIRSWFASPLRRIDTWQSRLGFLAGATYVRARHARLTVSTCSTADILLPKAERSPGA
jgi:hypothetical protein